MRAASWLLPAGLVSVAGAIKLVAMSGSAGLHALFLHPQALLLAVYTGESFSERESLFYFSDFFLDFSCAGINFFVIVAITIALLVPGASAHQRSIKFQLVQLALQCCLLLFTAFTVTLTANFLRVALYLRLQPLAEGRVWLHEAVGIAVFLAILISFSLFLYRIKNAKQTANT